MNRKTVLRLAKTAPYTAPYPNPIYPPSIYYRFFRLLVAEMRPHASVELGVCGGGGSLHLALGWPQGKVIGVDHALEYPENIEHVKKTCPNFQYWRMGSIDAAVQYGYRGGTSLDILFIDTVHTRTQTLYEFRAWKRYLRKGAVVILDDLFRNGMQEAWDELPGEKIRLDELHIGGGPEDGGFGVILL